MRHELDIVFRSRVVGALSGYIPYAEKSHHLVPGRGIEARLQAMLLFYQTIFCVLSSFALLSATFASPKTN